MRIIVTGGAGFIGSTLIRHLILHSKHTVLNLDKLTYSGNLNSLSSVSDHPRYHFRQTDICDRKSLSSIFHEFNPDRIMHLAAESHVDRSIEHPKEFLETNIIGTYNLLDASQEYLSKKADNQKSNFRFHHVSTDEVYGDLPHDPTALFTEETAYNPSSPYSASKASSDHLVRAWNRTYNLPILITNCSNNYGAHQFPEKLIPHTILNALLGKPLPLYGNGQQVRDWLYVEDHARALTKVVESGIVGETYNIGGHNEKRNIDVVRTICTILEELAPKQKATHIQRYEDLITYVADRPGHDQRYAIDASKIERTLGWKPQETFESGLKKTVEWYLNNEDWWSNVLSGNDQLERKGLK